MAKASFDVKVFSNHKQLQRQLSKVASEQLPFAMAKTLTEVAQSARDDVRRRLPTTFRVRSKRVPKSISMRFAHKRYWPRISALVFVRDQFLADHALGAVRRPKQSRYIAVPTRLVKRTSTGKVRKRDKPAEILRRGGHIKNDAIRERLRTSGKKSRRRVRAFFNLVRRAKIKKRWPIVAQVQAVAEREVPARFPGNLRRAIKTAKPKPELV